MAETLSCGSLLEDPGQGQLSGTKIQLTKDELDQVEEFINCIDNETVKQEAQSVLRQVTRPRAQSI